MEHTANNTTTNNSTNYHFWLKTEPDHLNIIIHSVKKSSLKKREMEEGRKEAESLFKI